MPAYNEQIVISSTIQSLFDCGISPTDIFMDQNSGKAAAQRMAIDQFKLNYKYDYVIMLDCDSIVSEDFKDVLYMNACKYPETDLFVGQVKSARGSSIISALRAVEYTFSHNIIKKGQDNFGVIYVSPGCASMYSTRILKRLQFDSSTLAEDMDLTLQVHSLTGKIRYIHEAEVITQDPRTLKDYNKQIMRWYRGFWQIVDKYNILKFGLKSRVSWYMLYIIMDTLVANRIFVISMSMFFLPLQLIITALAIDFTVYMIIAAYAAIETNRVDIVAKAPLTYGFVFLNTFAFVRSFVEVIVLRKRSFGWNKVTRYIGEQNEKVTDSPSSITTNPSVS
jgi:cellulose synthase/poly-beta-1,6-N-acetylglucosamine synthase-like glycosyltransferase